MVPYYGLGALALIGPKSSLSPVLIADALLVGLFAAVIGASGTLTAERGADRAGTLLTAVTRC